jgi:hypothetical protein
MDTVLCDLRKSILIKLLVDFAKLHASVASTVCEVRLPKQAKGQGRPASIDDVSSDFFSTFGIALIHGRAFSHSDVTATASAPVAIVSDAFAKAFWGTDDPLGKTIVTPDDNILS